MKARTFGLAAFAFGSVFLAAQAPQAADAPFSRFMGNWSGSGTISVRDGGRERIRCRGSNTGGGNQLKLGLVCASDSYKFELQSDITYEGGNISGSWGEVTRSVYGSLSGNMSSNQIQALAQAAGFSATLSISTRGNRQQVLIRSPGSEISEVAISLGRLGR
jgi:hypothetical protein